MQSNNIENKQVSRNRIFRITKGRIIFFLIFILMFIITEIGRRIYRPYIYTHEIFDFWIADTIGNLTGTIAIIFFELTLINPVLRLARFLIIGVTFGLIIYEFAQYFSPKSIVDWKDMIATIIGGAIALGIHELISRRLKEER